MTTLMYHDIAPAGAEDSSGFPGRDAARYKVTPELFAAHLKAIACQLFFAGVGAPPPTRANADASPRFSSAAAQRSRGRSPVLTFDDGGVSAMGAADALEHHGFRGHFFITVNYVGAPGFVDERDIRDLCRRGHTVGSHSSSHPLRMGHCSWPRLLDEWTRSRATLEKIIGEEIRTASVPGGDFAPRVAEAAARAGFTKLFTSEPTRKLRRVLGLTLLGRYTIQRWTTADTVAGLVTGAWVPCARQAIIWNAKKLSKCLSGEQYLKLRRLLLRHGDEVRWGDESG